MPDLDDQIRSALDTANESDPDVYSNELSTFRQATSVMRGRNRWIVTMVMVVTFVFTAFFFWSVYKFFNTTDLQQSIAWGFGGTLSFLATGSLKLWFWMQMDKYSVLREIKRLELQVALLVQKH